MKTGSVIVGKAESGRIVCAYARNRKANHVGSARVRRCIGVENGLSQRSRSAVERVGDQKSGGGDIIGRQRLEVGPVQILAIIARELAVAGPKGVLHRIHHPTERHVQRVAGAGADNGAVAADEQRGVGHGAGIHGVSTRAERQSDGVVAGGVGQVAELQRSSRTKKGVARRGADRARGGRVDVHYRARRVGGVVEAQIRPVGAAIDDDLAGDQLRVFELIAEVEIVEAAVAVHRVLSPAPWAST